MSNPNFILFESAKKSAYNTLRINYEQYKQTSSYQELGLVLRTSLYNLSLQCKDDRKVDEVVVSASISNPKICEKQNSLKSCFGML
jgi:hypothetical protein